MSQASPVPSEAVLCTSCRAHLREGLLATLALGTSPVDLGVHYQPLHPPFVSVVSPAPLTPRLCRSNMLCDGGRHLVLLDPLPELGAPLSPPSDKQQALHEIAGDFPGEPARNEDRPTGGSRASCVLQHGLHRASCCSKSSFVSCMGMGTPGVASGMCHHHCPRSHGWDTCGGVASP